MNEKVLHGRVTIPTDTDVIPETLQMIKRWGADAVRDCDGTDYPEELKNIDAKVYSTYYTTRKDNQWAKANLDEVQQMYIMTSFHCAVAKRLEIHLMDHLYPDMLKVNTSDDMEKWWEVIDRSTGEVIPYDNWKYNETTGNVEIYPVIKFHEYTVSFLAYIIWVTARRAILRKPIDRIGYGGYLKLALQFPEFTEYVESVCNEFRLLYDNISGCRPYCVKKVAVLNCWGKMRAWGNHMVHHAIYYKQNYSYAGIIESLSGAPFDVKFISFDDIKKDASILSDIDVVINVGDADTAYSGGVEWINPDVVTAIKEFVYNGGGFIGVGEPTAYQWQGHFFQLSAVLGVEMERGFTLNVDKYNWNEIEHFIIEDSKGVIDFGEGKKNIYALEGARIVKQTNEEVQLAVNDFEREEVYISVACLIVLKTAVFYIGRSCGLHIRKIICISGIVQIIMLKYMHI